MLCSRLVNANIVTMDPDRPFARTLGIWRGRIVGFDEDVASLPAREVVDLQGATLLPGFIDSHVHLAWTGLKQSTPSVAPCERVEDVLAVVAEAVSRSAGGDGAWVDVMGYDQRALGRHLTAAELDAVSPGRKVFLMHDSGHGCVVNSAVLGLLPDGVPHQDGFLAEGAMTAARRLRLPYGQDEIADAVERAARTCLSEGVTAVAEAGIGGGLLGHSPVELGAYQLLRDQGRLPLRVQLMPAGDTLRPREAHREDGIPRALDLGMRTGFGDDWLSLGALKIYTDGGMMARTAALTAPYAGTDHTGQLQDDPERLTRMIVDGHLGGWQLAVHAIGDRAADLALDALEEAQRLRPRPDARHRIEHAGLIRPDQLPRFARLGVSAVVQPAFLYSFGDDYADVMGEERAPWMYRGRGFLDHGVTLVGSSDRPVTDGAPLRAIQFMVERASASGRAIGPGEAVTVEEALRAYTVAGAYACRWDDRAGSLTPGKRADLVVLGDDPRYVDPSRISAIEVVETFVDGRQTTTDAGKL
ncbi:amidohydrolase [Streptomyces sp. NPDC059957]|uniref:amidohydrolase n=1 Tax=unclassified Streptomyces TaxID=2593676 RepID=UPI00364A9B7B